MADRLLLLELPPSLISACIPRRNWCISRRSSGGIGIAVPELRLASRLPLSLITSALDPHPSSSSSPSPPPNSSPAKLDLVSYTQHSDGSHVFRFGDESEAERSLEREEKVNSVGVKEQRAEIFEEASEMSMKQELKSDGTSELERFDDSESEVPNGKSNKKEEGKSAITLSVNPDAERSLQEKDRVASTNPRSVIKIKDRKRSRSPQKRKKETLSPENVPKHDDAVEVKHFGVSNLDSEDSSTSANPIVSGDEKAVATGESEKSEESEIIAEVIEKATESAMTAKSSPLNFSYNTPDSTKVIHNDIESETRGESSPSSELRSESHGSHEVTQEKMGNKVVPHGAETSVSDITGLETTSNNSENEASTEKEESTVADTKNDVFQVSASSIADLKSNETASGRDEIATTGFFLDSCVAAFQHPSEALAGRADAYFISHENWLGVADGVSERSFEGINLGTYAQELLSNCQKIISDKKSDQIADPVEVLSRSARETKSPGSSTALVAYFDDQALHAVNVGDSGFMVIRNGTVLRKSSPMAHEFGFPLQIVQGDDPSKLGEVYRVDLSEGDVVITATDGLFDNLYEKEIASIVSGSLQQSLEIQKISELLAAKAQEVGRSASARTPFADAAQAAGYTGYRGGKLDAVTVIVSLVRTRKLH